MNETLGLLAFGATGWGDEIALGTLITVALALTALPIGLVLGLLLALAKQSDAWELRVSANIFTTLFRGLPELLTLFIIYYGVQIGIQALGRFFVEGFYFEISSFAAGVVALAIVFSSYASEVFQSAFQGIPRGQYEGGDALGLSRLQVGRLVILPQLIRLALPGLSNLWLVLLKETALVSVIGLDDLLRRSGMAARIEKEPFLFFGIACLIYLLLAVLSSIGLGRIEAAVRRGEAVR